ncbi:E3 binding domain-containing protein [Streptomyces mirabilis]|nr:E3 binding domain-containing protein [Streptomyces mirabilis]
MRKLAAENYVDLASVKGTGVGGRIRSRTSSPPPRPRRPPPLPRLRPLPPRRPRRRRPWRSPRCAARPSRCPASARSSATTW